jgi:hypothetical protein
MELINPSIMWGLAAVVAPILIHFWNQKQAKIVEWAAMKWLVESQRLKARGFRFEDLLLFLIRLLAVILLVLIVAKPLINYTQKGSPKQREIVHVLAKDKRTVENFRFEINQAIAKKERVVWLDNLDKNLETLDDKYTEKEIHLSDIQNFVNTIPRELKDKNLNLYLPDDIIFKENPNVYLPKNSKAFFAKKDTPTKLHALHSDKYIFTDSQKGLTNSTIKPISEILKKTEVRVEINSENSDGNEKLKAAMEAIKEVYGFPFNYIKTKAEICIGNKSGETPKEALVILPNGEIPRSPNEIQLNTNLKSGIIYRAELPERLLEIILKHYKLDSDHQTFSRAQLQQVFKEKSATNSEDKILIDKYLCMFLLLVVMIERGLSIKNQK